MLIGLVLVPVVSLLTKAPETKRVEDIFSCYNRAVTVQAKHSIEM